MRGPGSETVFRIKSPELRTFLILQEEGSTHVFFLEDIDFYAVSNFDGEYYRLGFVDLRTRVGVKAACEGLEDAAAAAVELRDIPWKGVRLKAVFTLYPLNCGEGRSEGALALMINVEPHWVMYDWAKIAKILMSKEVERYVGWLRERFGPIDAVKIVG
jgi:hypothetical protein